MTIRGLFFENARKKITTGSTIIFRIFLLTKNYVSSPQSTSSESQLTLFAPSSWDRPPPQPPLCGCRRPWAELSCEPAAHRQRHPEPHPQSPRQGPQSWLCFHCLRRSQELTLSTNQGEKGTPSPEPAVRRGGRRESLCYSAFRNEGHWALLPGRASLRDSAAELQGQQAQKGRTRQEPLARLEGG